MLSRLMAGTALALSLAAASMAVAANSANVDAKKLLDANVRSANGDKVGEIEGVLLNSAGKTQAVVVDVGGFLGIGERRITLDWNDLTVTENGDKVTTQYTKDQLKGMPEYKLDTTRRETAYHDPDYRTARKDTHTSQANSGEWAKAAGNLKGSELIGADLVNSKDDKVGTVKEVLFDATGKIKTLLVDPQGIMGGGNKTVAIDLSKVQIMQSGEDLRLVTPMTEEQLKALPDHERM